VKIPSILEYLQGLVGQFSVRPSVVIQIRLLSFQLLQCPPQHLAALLGAVVFSGTLAQVVAQLLFKGLLQLCIQVKSRSTALLERTVNSLSTKI
jgi:hypothetical protein